MNLEKLLGEQAIICINEDAGFLVATNAKELSLWVHSNKDTWEPIGQKPIEIKAGEPNRSLSAIRAQAERWLKEVIES